MTIDRQSLLAALQGVNADAGPPATKVTVAGAVIVSMAMWDAINSTVFSVMIYAWAFDMASGSMRAIKQGGGLKAWTFDRFSDGFLKAGVAVIAMGLGVLMDVLAGIEQGGAAVVAMGLLTAAFGASAAKNIGHFFPTVGEFLGEVARRIPGGRSTITEEQVREEDEKRRGRRPPGDTTAPYMNGTEH